MGKLRIAIVGCGGIANQKHMPSIKANADKAEMVAFCDLIPERAEKAAKEVKKTAEKVTKEVKKAAPKTTAKKSAAKKEIKTEVVLQYGEKEVNTKDMIASVKKDWTKQKHKISEIKSIELYVKPEDYAVYYVINGEHTGKVWL